MKRRLDLTDERGAVRFGLLFTAFRTRGGAKPDESVGREKRRLETSILKALKGISEPVGDEPAAGDADMRARTLIKGGAVLELEQPAFKLLTDYVDATPWQSGVSDVVDALLDEMDTCEKVDA